MSKREFLMLAHTYREQYIGGWLWSFKLDGDRFFWDGGVSRGVPASQVPWANTQKDHIKVTPPVSTGLWSRGAKVINAPNWWLDQLPDIPLDGEGYCGDYQRGASIIRRDIPTRDWQEIQFKVFDSPISVFDDGTFEVKKWPITLKNVHEWTGSFGYTGQPTVQGVYNFLKGKENEVWQLVKQEKLPYNVSQEHIDSLLRYANELGYEGLVIRDPDSKWTPERSHNLLKVKPWHDAEGLVQGFIWGQGKLYGKMGSLLLKMKNGTEFALSGFTDEEREVESLGNFPGKECFESTIHFKIGDEVTFKYRELSNEGVPKEARYLRKR